MPLTYKFCKLMYMVSKRLPNWLFKFNQGTVYHTKSPALILRRNSKFAFERVEDRHIVELSDFSGFSVSQLQARLDAGDIGIISREIDSQKITSIQWAHRGNTYIRGMNLKLEIPENTAYLYWAYSEPRVRLTGVFNMAFQNMIDLLREREINDFVGLVEFWNKSAHKYHHRLKFVELSSVLYLKILFVRLTFLKDIGTNKTSCSINILTVKDSDVI